MDTIKSDEVLPGDILLYHGDALISKLIRFFDGTEVNHAAVCIGADTIGEAQAAGLARSSMGSLRSPDYAIVRRLKTNPGTMQPVVDKAEYYLNSKNKYAFDQILLLAFLALSRKLQVNPYLKWVLRKLLDNAADWLTKNGDKQPMICSEYVYRCYDEALPTEQDPYSLNIEPFPIAGPGRTRGGRALARATPRSNIHRDSLLAWVSDITTSSDRSASGEMLRSIREPAPRGIARRLSAAEKKMSAMPLDDLIDSYLKETRKPPARSLEMEASLRTPEILGSIEKFGEALYLTQKKPNAAARKMLQNRGVEDQVTANLANLLKTTADFVTPGDLYKCIDLYDVGQILPGT